MSRRCGTARIAKVIRQALDDGHVVDIAGLGTFRPGADGFEFVPETRPRVFIAYVQEDLAAIERLYIDLTQAGYQPWLDKWHLLAGQNWARAIDHAIDVSDFFIPCFSKRAVLKRGRFHSELRYALDCASELPLDDIFVIPVRLDECTIPDRINACLQHVDMYPSWDAGMGKIRRTVDHEVARRRRIALRPTG